MAGNENTPNPTETATPPVVDTNITVNGRQFQLAGMSAAEGAELYNVLPAQYQQLADFYAQLAQSFERVQQVQLPSGMSFQNAWENTINALDRGRGQLDANAPQYMRDIVAAAPQLAQQIPGAGVVTGAINGTQAMVNGAGTFYGAFRDTLMAVPRTLNALYVSGRELVGAAGGGINEEQAHAFGAAYAGAIMYQGEARRAAPFIDWPGRGSQFFSNPLEYSMAGLDWVALNVPVVNSVWPYIEAAGQFIGQWFRQGEGKSYSELLQESQQRAEVRRASGRTTYNDLVEDRMRPTERDRAAGQITAAQEIAGVRTAELAQLGNEGGIYTDQNGRTAAVDPTGATPTISNEPGPNGQGEGRLDRAGQAWSAVPGNLLGGVASGDPASIALTAGGAYAGYRVMNRWVVPPIVAGSRNLAALPVSAYGNLVNTAEGQSLFRAQNRFDSLTARHDALEQQIEQTRTRHTAATGREQARIGRELRSLESELGNVNRDLDGHRTLLGRQVPGARADFEQAKTAFAERVERTPGAVERLERAQRAFARADSIAGRPASSAPAAEAETAAARGTPRASATAQASDDIARDISRAARTPGAAAPAVETAAARPWWARMFTSNAAPAVAAEVAPATGAATSAATRAAVASESGLLGGLRSGLRGLSQVRGGWRAAILGSVGAGGLWLLGHGDRAQAAPAAAAEPAVPADASVGTTRTQAAAAGSITASTYGLTRMAAARGPLAATVEGAGGSVLRRLGGPILGTALAIPGIVEANNEGDGHEVTRQVGGAVGGLATGAAAGAAAGAWFGGVGAIPGAIIGGLIGYFGGSSVADYAVGDRVHAAYAERRAELARANGTTPAAAPTATAAAPAGSLGTPDEGLALAATDPGATARSQAVVFRNSNVSGGSTVTLADATEGGAARRPQTAAPAMAPLVFVS